ncbi:MAG: hypothetical protein R3E84_06340 [Pseudomonadales bacterium]
MTTSPLVIVGADSPRCRGYVSALIQAGMHDLEVVRYGPSGTRGQAQAGERTEANGLWYPDIHTPLDALCGEYDLPLIVVDAPSINAPEVVNVLRRCPGDLGVFAGRGGEIVDKRTLEAAPRLLHMHPGPLPDMRGSTTLYYAILQQQPVTVTGIVLAPEIDAGPIVHSRRFDWPPAGIDVDQLYDTAIRAATLVDIIRGYTSNGALIEQPQPAASTSADDGMMYFVIHPVLKHLALLAVEQGRQPAAFQGNT